MECRPPRRLELKRRFTSRQIKLSLEGERLGEAHYNVLVEENCDCYDADTKALIFRFRKKVISSKNIDLAKSIFGKIDEKMKMSNTRGAAAGKVVEMAKLEKKRSTKYNKLIGLKQIKGKKGFAYKQYGIDVKKLTDFSMSSQTATAKIGEIKLFGLNGKAVECAWTEHGWKPVRPVTYKQGATAISNPVKSYKAGWYYDRFKKVNRIWGFTRMFPSAWEKASPFFQEIGSEFKHGLPQVYKVHEERMAQHPLTTVAEGVPLSSCSINVNYTSYCHKDRGDLNDGISTLTVINGAEGSYEGGFYVLPEYQVAVNVEEGDILFSQSHNLWHGNTGIRSIKGGKRISFVTYLKKSLAHGTKTKLERGVNTSFPKQLKRNAKRSATKQSFRGPTNNATKSDSVVYSGVIKKQKTAFWKSKSKIYLWNDEADYDLGDLVYDPSAGNNKFFWQVIAKNGSTHEMVELSGLNGYPKIPCGSLIYC